jgi:hypothetical protein
MLYTMDIQFEDSRQLHYVLWDATPGQALIDFSQGNIASHKSTPYAGKAMYDGEGTKGYFIYESTKGN